ncbi:uncharacterized protein B0H64DRAFT_398042 [Chaetomium fimeti]|uniref:Uncharacterized protein n=1 Tax=Chaetomium fimeti TaxID=1854472 RepID=A0AAE0HGX8_9PEZI|nr:hypothetical protein B0H64DRAFT_398042 [Chaetomium fimeti]
MGRAHFRLMIPASLGLSLRSYYASSRQQVKDGVGAIDLPSKRDHHSEKDGYILCSSQRWGAAGGFKRGTGVETQCMFAVSGCVSWQRLD